MFLLQLNNVNNGLRKKKTTGYEKSFKNTEII